MYLSRPPAWGWRAMDDRGLGIRARGARPFRKAPEGRGRAEGEEARPRKRPTAGGRLPGRPQRAGGAGSPARVRTARPGRGRPACPAASCGRRRSPGAARGAPAPARGLEQRPGHWPPWSTGPAEKSARRPAPERRRTGPACERSSAQRRWPDGAGQRPSPPPPRPRRGPGVAGQGETRLTFLP
jgi:hypothetical protein